MIRSKIASRFKRVKKMLFLWAVLALALHVVPGAVGPARAQGSRKDDIVFNSRGTPLAGATIRVCAMPASGQPCAPLALIYSDAALTQALANPTTTDGLGNYFFYVAPGKYEIEISGPAITTKQIPNVILPSDPSSPTFTGGITAFSLNLSGNLTVNGNTTVIGNLASGTLNLSNQLTPPGAAAAGTVNFYTKTDKRLYYKDDTGAEIGPIANTTGAQTNVTNTFTASQNFDADLHFKGPNPYVDVTRYGVRATATNAAPAIPGITASINNGSTSATLSSASSFQNGDGVVIFGAGPAQSMTTPSAPTVTQSVSRVMTGTGDVVTGPVGATTYNYKIVWRDKLGGLTAASAAGTTTTGAASLGAQSVAITSASRSGTTVTVTTSSAHGLVTGSMVFIAGASDTTFSGWYSVSGSADNTHFTFTSGLDTASGATTSSTGGTVSWWNCNHVVSGAAPAGGVQFYVYSDRAVPGTFALIGASRINLGIFTDLTFDDFGSPMMDNALLPYFVPSAAPSVATSDSLVTTIASGAGTTTLTLGNAAGTTVAGATILFDNAPNIKAAATAAAGNDVYFPIPVSGSYVVNSWLDLTALNPTLSFASGLFLNDTVQIASSSKWYGDRMPVQGNCAQFCWQGNPSITASHANPGVLVSTGTGSSSNSVAFQGLNFQSNSNAGNAMTMDGGFNESFDQVAFLTLGGITDYLSIPLIMRGQLGNQSVATPHFRKVFFSGGNSGGATPLWYCNDCGSVKVDEIFMVHRGILFRPDNTGSLQIQWGYIQGSNTPFITATGTLAGSTSSVVLDINHVTLDTVAHPLVAYLPSQGAASVFTSLNSNGAPSSGISSTTGNALASTNLPSGQNINVVSGSFFSNNSAQVNGTFGTMGYALSTPAAPTVAISGGTGPAAGTYNYQIFAVDTFPIILGSGKGYYGTSGLSPVSSSIVVNGAQGILVSWTLVPGQVATIVCRNGLCPDASGTGFLVTGNSLLDTGAGWQLNTFQVHSSGLSSGCTASGCETQLLNLTGGGFKSTLSGTFTANRTQTLPDATGFIPVTAESFSSSPRAEQNVFLPGALTSTWTGATWTADKAVTVTRLQVQAKTAPAGCTTNAIVRLTDGTTPVSLTISAAANDSGAITQNYAAGSSLQILVQTAAVGCTTSPADANVTVQYRMQ